MVDVGIILLYVYIYEPEKSLRTDFQLIYYARLRPSDLSVHAFEEGVNTDYTLS